VAGSGFLAVPLVARGQPGARIARIGYLAVSLDANPASHEAFREGLRELGYVEGRDLVIEYRDAHGNDDRLPALAAEIAALKVDVMVTNGGTLAAMAAQQASKTLPIVFVAAGEPVSSGLVASLGRPGGNITGLSLLFPELVGKCLEQLKQVVPRVARVAVLIQPGAVPARTQEEILKAAEGAARTMRLQLHVVGARNAAEIDQAFADMSKARVNGLAVMSTPMFASERRHLVELAAKGRLPAVYSFRLYVDAGGLVSYGPNVPDLARRAAIYVDRILKGARPGDLPVEQPTKFELIISLKTAKALGLTIPQTVLARADQVID
jgi:putative ABC transport system substrate-binding protein